eukprot:CAMPEP_0198594878 /NCGR_PEP_ID=MMETSP1462-20131121/141179_1 /TAXON_ID=1333877 /ORGANISM="Brandtodinium nutriculum, Strain RCC3387" /LENGTH=180 /DNA_ID=CAMNT_0044326501 /DNA_START=103 /DNA_END=641 /DNA_ORIENTATION=+
MTILADIFLFFTQLHSKEDMVMLICTSLLFKLWPLTFVIRRYCLRPAERPYPECQNPDERVAHFKLACAVAPCARLPQLEDKAPKGIGDNDLEAGGGDDESDEWLCTICLENMVAPQLCGTLGCGHKFHAACVEHWWRVAAGTSAACPVCRHEGPAAPAPPSKAAAAEAPAAEVAGAEVT